MMLYPPMSSLVDKVGSRYLLVNLVARRARQIANEAEENGEILEEAGLHGDRRSVFRQTDAGKDG
jgi:DNA-directed RNA polymerase omega subunit